MFTFCVESHEPSGPLTKNCLKLDKNKSTVSRFSVLQIGSYSTYTERRSAFETAIEFALLSF